MEAAASEASWPAHTFPLQRRTSGHSSIFIYYTTEGEREKKRKGERERETEKERVGERERETEPVRGEEMEGHLLVCNT